MILLGALQWAFGQSRLKFEHFITKVELRLLVGKELEILLLLPFAI